MFNSGLHTVLVHEIRCREKMLGRNKLTYTEQQRICVITEVQRGSQSMRAPEGLGGSEGTEEPHSCLKGVTTIQQQPFGWPLAVIGTQGGPVFRFV